MATDEPPAHERVRARRDDRAAALRARRRGRSRRPRATRPRRRRTRGTASCTTPSTSASVRSSSHSPARTCDRRWISSTTRREPRGWSYTDPVLLQAQGSASGARRAAHDAGGCRIAGRPHPRRRHGSCRPARSRSARRSPRRRSSASTRGSRRSRSRGRTSRRPASSRGSRCSTRRSRSIDDTDGFDLVWLPSFFIPENVLDDAISRIHSLLRPGGTLVVGTMQGDRASARRRRRRSPHGSLGRLDRQRRRCADAARTSRLRHDRTRARSRAATRHSGSRSARRR